MAKYKTKMSEEVIVEAQKIAKGTQKPGQTKEQTKLIAQGIQKGIEQFKKKQKSKSRELDKKIRKVNQVKAHLDDFEPEAVLETEYKTSKLPWCLLAVSWLGFIVYLYGPLYSI